MPLDKSRKEKAAGLESTLRAGEQGDRYPVVPILDEDPEDFADGHIWILRPTSKLCVAVDGEILSVTLS